MVNCFSFPCSRSVSRSRWLSLGVSLHAAFLCEREERIFLQNEGFSTVERRFNITWQSFNFVCFICFFLSFFLFFFHPFSLIQRKINLSLDFFINSNRSIAEFLKWMCARKLSLGRWHFLLLLNVKKGFYTRIPLFFFAFFRPVLFSWKESQRRLSRISTPSPQGACCDCRLNISLKLKNCVETIARRGRKFQIYIGGWYRETIKRCGWADESRDVGSGLSVHLLVVKAPYC